MIAPTNNRPILFIEDDKTLAELTIMLLENDQIQSVHARDGKEALAHLKNNSFSLIVTDLNMPQTDGLSLITELKALGSNIPVIVMTGVTSQEVHDKLYALGVEKIYVKPLMSQAYQQLITDIKRYL